MSRLCTVFKDHQYLVFALDDGSVVKYDFATKMPIGKKGGRVSNLKGQLKGITINDICESCRDPQYGKFLKFVMWQGGVNGAPISNIGTVLENVPRFAAHEQIFSAGISNVESHLRYGINDIPRGLLKVCRERDIRLGNAIIDNYKANPDAYTLMFSMKFESLTDADLFTLLSFNQSRYGAASQAAFIRLINDYGYQAKALLLYIDSLKTYEAIDNISSLLTELIDYARMMSEISRKFEHYPKHFLTTHKIAMRNYNRLKTIFDENAFKDRIKKDMERTIGRYAFIYPDCTQDIKDEAVQQNNCVSSYIKRVINGECDVMFMRDKEDRDKSLVTLEVVNGKIVQAKQHFNYEVTPVQQDAIDKWNKWYAQKMEEKKNAA